MGRVARVRGQAGSCSFITWDAAIQQYNRGDRDSLEVVRALNSNLMLHDIVMKSLHKDRDIPVHYALPAQKTLQDLKEAVAGVKWFA
jgi:hypothetical protein